MLKMKEYRVKRKISQQELSKLLGISQQAVANYELGTREPNIDMLVKISTVLDVSIEDLIDFKAKQEQLWAELNEKILEKENEPKS